MGNFIQSRDPNHRIPFHIFKEINTERLLTGYDFDLESFIIAADGTLRFGVTSSTIPPTLLVTSL